MTLDPDRPEERRDPSEPHGFRGRSLSASLTVDDITASVAWYRDVMGFHVAEEYEEEGELWGARVMAGHVEVFLNQDDGAKGRDRQKGVGMSFQISTVQDIDELAARIKERGGALAAEPADMPWGARQFRIKDPDGFTYSIASSEPGE